MSVNGKMVGVVAAVAFLAACSDSPVAPTTVAKVVKPTFVTAGDLVGLNAVPEPGKIKVCKVWDGTAGGGTTITAAITADRVGTIVNSSPVIVGANPKVHANLQCELYATSTQNGGFDDISITETVPAGAELVLDQRFDYTGGGPLVETAFANGDAVGFNSVHGSTIVFTNRLLPEGGEGCTPGYWKQDQHLGNWTGYAPGADFDATFGVDFFDPNVTLQEAAGANGGGLNALARHGVAALLNAASADVDYEYTTGQVIAIVQGTGAYAGLSVEARKNLLVAQNELGCDLARAEVN